MSACEETVTTVKADILSLEGHRKEAISNSELHQTETLLDTLEASLHCSITGT
jgi:hypothetical protein